MILNKIVENIENLNFTAIDFETANEQRNSICSIGIVIVRQGKIIEKKNYLVKPKEFRFTEVNKRIHGICEKDVVNEPEFNFIWQQIQHFFINQIVLAHNVDFDIDALKQTLNTYQLTHPVFKYICTQKLAQEVFKDLQNYRLADVAKYLNIPLVQHDSVSDAIISAEIGIRALPMYDKTLFNYNSEELTIKIVKKASIDKKDKIAFGFKEKKIDSNILKQNTNVINSDNIFYNKKVVFTGDLHSIKRQDAAIKLQQYGADINTSISKKTNIVIVGDNAGPSKMKIIEEIIAQGGNIRKIYEDEFVALLKELPL